jgi:hypothetical protein
MSSFSQVYRFLPQLITESMPRHFLILICFPNSLTNVLCMVGGSAKVPKRVVCVESSKRTSASAQHSTALPSPCLGYANPPKAINSMLSIKQTLHSITRLHVPEIATRQFRHPAHVVVYARSLLSLDQWRYFFC